MIRVPERTLEEATTDRLLLLYLVNQANRFGYDGGKTILQKIVFACQKTFEDKGIKGMNYIVVRWYHGPFSFELADDMEYLQRNGLLTSSFDITDKAEDMLNRMDVVIKRNSDVVSVLDVITKSLANKSLEKMLEIVYKSNFKLPDGRTMKISDIPLETVMIPKPEAEKSKSLFTIPKEWMETLEVFFDSETMEALENSRNDIAHGRIRKFEF